MNKSTFEVGKREKGKPLTIIQSSLVKNTLEIREWRTNYYMGEKPDWHRINPSRVVRDFQGELNEETVLGILSAIPPVVTVAEEQRREVEDVCEKSGIEAVVDFVEEAEEVLREETENEDFDY